MKQHFSPDLANNCFRGGNGPAVLSRLCVCFCADASECAKKTSPADPAPAADNKADLGG